MAFNALIVTFGLSRVLTELNLTTAFTTYSIFAIVMMLNAYLLYRFFGTGPSPKGGGKENRPDQRQPHRSPEPSLIGYDPSSSAAYGTTGTIASKDHPP